MAAVPVTLVGIFTTETGSVNGTFNGVASLSGLSVGGGPIDPPSIWPSPGHPAHPIAPGGPPPIPAHPIVLPDPPIDPPPIDPPTSPPSPQWSWVWNVSNGWHPAFVPGKDDPQPH